VREQQAMPFEEAIYRLTGKTALLHDITDRGFIAAGKVADVTIFDRSQPNRASRPRRCQRNGELPIDHALHP
jgi:N-acyl-D-aspartate/D-glutamate deacylase